MDDRHGARQPHRFDPARSGLLDDEERFAYVPPARLLEMLDLPSHGTLLDFGTGTGTYALAIARARPDVRVYALDEQEPMLARVRAKLASSPLANVTVIGPDALAALRVRVARSSRPTAARRSSIGTPTSSGRSGRPASTSTVRRKPPRGSSRRVSPWWRGRRSRTTSASRLRTVGAEDVGREPRDEGEQRPREGAAPTARVQQWTQVEGGCGGQPTGLHGGANLGLAFERAGGQRAAQQRAQRSGDGVGTVEACGGRRGQDRHGG